MCVCVWGGSGGLGARVRVIDWLLRRLCLFVRVQTQKGRLRVRKILQREVKICARCDTFVFKKSFAWAGYLYCHKAFNRASPTSHCTEGARERERIGEREREEGREREKKK